MTTGQFDSSALRMLAPHPIEHPDAPAMPALDRDGRLWRRVWVAPDRLVVEFVDVASAEVDDHGGVCFDRELPPELAEHLLLDHLVALHLSRRGHVVFHGAVISNNDRAVVLVGRSGAGKSTLAAFAGQRGWSVGGDDGAIVLLGDVATVQPTCATLRLTADASSLLGIDPGCGARVGGKSRLTTSARPGPLPLAAIVVLEPTSGEECPGLAPLTGVDAHAALFGHTFHVELAGGPLMRNLLDQLVVIAETVLVGRLSAPRSTEGLADVERILRRLVAQ